MIALNPARQDLLQSSATERPSCCHGLVAHPRIWHDLWQRCQQHWHRLTSPTPRFTCQQQDAQAIRRGRKGHGLQALVSRTTLPGDGDWIVLRCGCSLPVAYLPLKERAQLHG